MKIDTDREVAYKALLAIEREGSYSNLELSKLLNGDEISNKGFIREIVYGVIENKIYLDYILDKFIKNGVRKTKLQALIILRMGVYQILFMNSVPNYATVNESVALTRRFAKGMDGFINGVLRNFIRNMDSAKKVDVPGRLEYLSIRYSCRIELVEELVNMLGFEHTKLLLEHAGKRPTLSIRVNKAKISVEELAERLRAKGFDTQDSKLSDRVLIVKGGDLTETNEYKEGLFSIQSEESCAIADFADAKSAELVIDLCAAPGGKTAAMAEQMLKASNMNESRTVAESSTESGKIIALEIYEHRSALIEATSRRLGLDNIEVKCHDATKQIDELVGKADLVLADVPCSGLGVIRRKPEIKYRDEFDFDELVEIQKNILETGSSYVKYGGKLVYSTCTVNPMENERIIENFLTRHDDFISEKEIKLSPFANGYDGFYMNKLKKVEGRVPNGCGVQDR